MKTVIAYSAPEGAKVVDDCGPVKRNIHRISGAAVDLSDDYSVSVNGRELPVYRCFTHGYANEEYFSHIPSFGGPYSFAYFDFEGTARVTVTSHKRPLDNLKIQPLSKNLAADIDGQSVSFELTAPPIHISIEPDGRSGPLLLFANPLEESPPAPQTPGVRYFGPGVHEAGIIELSDNQTLYIAGGAVVKGGIEARGTNIRIMGRGILDGFDRPRDYHGSENGFVRLEDCDNVLIEGIILKDGWAWNLNLCGCDNVRIRNLKIVAARCENDDGIDICNCRGVRIEDCFIRTEDDCIAPKGFGYRGSQEVSDIEVVRCVLWSDKAHIWRIGCECRAAVMRDMRFRDIDVVHYSNNWWIDGGIPERIEPKPVWDEIPEYMLDLPTCISIQPGEDMLMENLRFEDIRINHEGQKWFMEIFPKPTLWSQRRCGGMLRGCVFKDVRIDGEHSRAEAGIRICGLDESHDVRDVVFDNVTRDGRRLSEESPGLQMRGHISNITFV
ncbi:MAG: glycosyl hydrolase family 28 protein [Planctomycetaceae bacterium]|nr:hypothetical protein [Planctomycetaceae bacterium]